MAQKMNPFPGLRPFEMQEKYLFFGREDQTVELLKRLGQARFMAVVGTSGSGKSSLVRAGLLPELHGGTMTDAGSSWEIAVMRPGGDPLTNLAKSLEDSGIYDTDEEGYYRHLRAMLGRSTMGLIEAVSQSTLEKEDNLLIVVDQFEEIFRFRSSSGKHAEEAANFISLLLEATQQTSKSIFVTITMRSDFLGDCSQFRGLAEAVEQEHLQAALSAHGEVRWCKLKPGGATGSAEVQYATHAEAAGAGASDCAAPIVRRSSDVSWADASTAADGTSTQ